MMMNPTVLAQTQTVNDREMAAFRYDSGRCVDRALLAQATAEARDRRVPLERWMSVIVYASTTSDRAPALARASTQAIYDAEGVYTTRPPLTPKETFKLYYKVCMQVKDHNVVLSDTQQTSN